MRERMLAERRRGLSDLLARWQPEQHHEVLALIDRARALTSDLPARRQLERGTWCARVRGPSQLQKHYPNEKRAAAREITRNPPRQYDCRHKSAVLVRRHAGWFSPADYPVSGPFQVFRSRNAVTRGSR